MKKLIFVSTGRCGTKRLYEVLNQYLPDGIAVVHQMTFSRLGNILGTLTITTQGKIDFSFLYRFLIRGDSKQKTVFVSTDPLSAALIPMNWVKSKDCCIVHLERDPDEFAKSIFKLSRRRIFSFIAHNFIPCWQPGIYPLENIFNKNIYEKYKRVCTLKNKYFADRYRANPNYRRIDFEEAFTTNFIQDVVHDFLNITIIIPPSSLDIKSNEN
ncbi:MAG: hypothetical protein KQH59_21345 [Desulfobulbaceae bacterium]|nr:hypothetical protein [Desulfobulbaceae bacterium]